MTEAKFRKFAFKRNGSAWYERVPELTDLKKVPTRLKVEETWQERIRCNGTAYTCHDGKKDGEHDFFTGLLAIPNVSRCYVGNQYANGKTSLCIFRFSDDLEGFELFFFNNFYVNDRARQFEYAQQFLVNH